MERSFRRPCLFAAALVLLGALPAQAFQLQDADGNTAPAPGKSLDLSTPAPAGPNHRAFFGDRKTVIEQGNFSLQFGTRGNYGSAKRGYDFDSQFDRYNPFGAQNR